MPDLSSQKFKTPIEEVLSLLKEFIEFHGDQCQYDHHGFCQEHFLEPLGRCLVARSKKLLEFEELILRNPSAYKSVRQGLEQLERGEFADDPTSEE
jgi:hypothetical protein